jgi:outer membrane usher protein
MQARSKPLSSSSAKQLAKCGLLVLALISVDSSQADPLIAATDGTRVRADVSDEDELLVLVDVNSQHLDETIPVLRSASGSIWVPEDSLKRWRLRHPEALPKTRNGVVFLPLDSIAGTTYVYDASTLHLTITARPESFLPSALVAGGQAYPPPTVPEPGGFLNYDLFASRASGLSTYAGTLEAGFFNPYGVLVSSMLAQHGSDGPGALRLDTTWTSDFPDRLTTARLGDTVNVPGAWGRAVRFGGVQYGTNFATQPGFVAFPTIAANGQAALPSTVDVFVNNALVAQRPVPPGPFSFTNIPTITGGGNVQLVVRDLFGREQIITQPFYASSALLQTGLSQYSYEAGFERNRFGTESFDYGHALASATYRHGLSDQLTGEVHGESMRDKTAVGMAADYLITDIGVVHGLAAVSRAEGGLNGRLFGLGFERQAAAWSVAAQSQRTTSDFRQIGFSPDSPLPRAQTTASLGYQAGPLGSVNLTYVARSFYDAPELKILSLAYTLSFSFGTLNFVANKTYGSDGGLALSTTFSVPFGTRDAASISHDVVRNKASGTTTTDTLLTYQRNLPAGDGYGYRLSAHARDDLQASGTLQNEFGRYTADVTHFQGQAAARVDVAGGLGYMDGYAFASRQITDSFGIVRVDDYPGVTVLLDNQAVGTTDARGYAMLPRLRAYDINPISIEQNDLPMDAQVDRLKIEAVPYYRSGVLLRFPVRRSHGAIFRILLDDGEGMPSGSTIQLAGGDDVFPVALDGAAYVTGLQPHNSMRATWNHRSCDFELEVPPSADPLPDLGTFVCHGVMR